MFAALLIIFITYIVAKIIQRRRQISEFLRVRRVCIEEFQKLRGPPTAPIFGSLWYFKSDPVELVKQAQTWYLDYALQPDSCGLMKFWFGPMPVVGITRGDVAKQIFDSSVNISKSSQYDKLKEWIGEGLLISTNEKWRSRRKMLTQTFHFAVLKEYQKVFGAQGKVLVDVLKIRANGTYPFDIMPYIKRCTLDIICETAMGCSIGSQSGGSDDYVTSVKRLSELVWIYEKSPHYWIPAIWQISGKAGEFQKHIKITTDFTRKVIERRKEELENSEDVPEEKKKLAFLDFLIKSQKEHQLSDEDIREEVDTFMFEGHDTTSSGITFAIWFLGQHPEYQRKVQEELDDIFGDDYERHPDSEDFHRMVFLEQCIKETLRITPPVPFVSRKLVEDVVIPHPTKGSVTLPAGMSIMVNIIAIMKDARFFEKPYQFFPEHFDPDRVSAREAFAYIPFSAGPRNCIGQKFALLEEKAVLLWIFRLFSVESMTKWPEDLPVPELILKPLHGTQILLRNRKKL